MSRKAIRSPDKNGVCYRYVDLRYDGERTISGVALRYGDTATLPWGLKERFQAGAFGPIGNSDIILNVQHARGRPIARTGGGGLSIEDDPAELRLSAQLPETREANDTLELVRSKILRGFSIEFIPGEVREEKGVRIIEKAELRNIAVVDRPAYKQSRITSVREAAMDEKQIRELIESYLAKREGKDGVDAAALATELATSLREGLDADIEKRVQEALDKEAEKRREAEEEAQRLAREEEERAGKHRGEMDKMRGEMDKMRADMKKMKDDMKKMAASRAELLVQIHPLLPDDTKTEERSDHELLVLAVGDEVENAEDRSEDYLRAKVEGILERRAAGGPQPGGQPPKGGPAPQPGNPAGPVNIIHLVEKRHQQTRRTA